MEIIYALLLAQTRNKKGGNRRRKLERWRVFTFFFSLGLKDSKGDRREGGGR